MVKYTLKDLLIGTSLVAVGLFVIAMARSGVFREHFQRIDAALYLSMTAQLTGGAIIGIGATIPFKRPWIGLLIGLVGMYVFLAFEAEVLSRFR